MDKSLPSLQEWRGLYFEAIEFKNIKSWEWMFDSDLFGVQNPENSEIGYCCVLGNSGEFFGLAVYLGTKGLESYLKIQSGQVQPGDPDSLYIQDCLMASFEDRKFLQKEDLQIIKDLGLKFRGPNSWPIFRNYKPGYFPWFLNKNEIIYLTLVLQQTKEVCLRCKENKKVLYPPEKNYYLVRVPEVRKNTLIWKDEYLQPTSLKIEKISSETWDEIRIQRIKRNIRQTNLIWEVDFFHAPTPIKKEDERPYFPYVFLFVDQGSGFIFHAHVTKLTDYREEFQKSFLECIEKTGIMPIEIQVKKYEVFELLEPTSAKLNITIRLVDRLKSLEMARKGMIKFFKRG
ncbi:MAG: hypothetical protein AB1410_02515 [Acidobacteriota bacterium]